MFESDEMDRNDPLKDYYREIGNEMMPPSSLVAAVKGGVYLNPAARTGTHVWKFAKAVVCYALGIVLFLGAILWLPALWQDDGPAVGTRVPNETTEYSDNTVLFPKLSPELKAEVEAAWLNKYGTELKWWYEYSLNADAGVRCYGSYDGCVVLYETTMLAAVTTKKIAGYEFVCSSSFILCAYKDGEIIDLADAYDRGWLCVEEIAEIAEQHEMIHSIHSQEYFKQQIVAAYAKQFDADPKHLSVRIVDQFGGVYAVYVDDTSVEYGAEKTEEVVHGLSFAYSNAQTMLLYRFDAYDGEFYTLPEAAEQGVISKENVRKLYITHNFAALDYKQKLYCTATLEDEFSDHQIVIAVYPEFNGYSYTEKDFSFIRNVKVEEIAAVGDVGGNVEISLYRFLLLTLDQSSKEQLLKHIKRLEVEKDLYCAMPYGYEKAPELPPPETEPVIDPTEMIEEAIVTAYAQRYGKDSEKLSVRIEDRIGNAYAVFVDGDVQYEAKASKETVGGYIFRYETAQTLLLYCNGEIYTLAEVYEKDLLGRYNFSRLYYQYEKKYPHLYEESYIRSLAEAEIKQLCPERFGIGTSEDYSARFVMTVGQGYVIYIDGPIPIKEEMTTQKICGLEFVYQSSQVMEFYEDGKFYSLPDAFEQGILHRMTIHWLYSLHNPEITEEIIRAHVADEDYADKMEEDHMVRFVAKIGDRYAVFVDCPHVAYPDEVITVTINGLNFVYGDYHQMEIYHNGSFYSVSSAFEKGVLSENQLRYLYEIHRGNYDYLYTE